MNDQSRRVQLYEAMQEHFNLEEIRMLCFMLGIDSESLDTRTLSAAIRELITFMERQNHLPLLIIEIKKQRPDLSLSFIQDETQYPQASVQVLEYIAEAKLILVGDGNVGKTSLVNRLVYETFNDSEDMTRGVAITHWFSELPCLKDQNARVNIWDFGGQGNMHATHPYFFSRQAVYLIVLNVREDDRANRAEYWLRLIQTYGGDSPIIVVANKSDQYSTLLDEQTLKNKYPRIAGFIRTSCKTNEGISDLKSEISKAICLLEDIGTRTPQSLVKVKEILENMTDPKSSEIRDTLDLDEYEDICDQCEVNPEYRIGFLRRLNDLGVMLYFDDDPRLELNVVLNPFWVTEGVYTIINHESLANSGGKFHVNQIREILPRRHYPSNKAMYILDMMRKFELCFPLIEDHNLFLLPDLLPPQQPELPEFNREEALKLQFEYPIYQPSILTRLLVRLNHYFLDDFYWRNGAMFTSLASENRALVIADEVDRRLRIWVDGDHVTRRNFLNRIREELNVIHKGQRSEDVKEWVITQNSGQVSYKLLVQLESIGKETHYIEVDGEAIELNIKELLDGVRAEKIPDSLRLTELIVESFSLNELDRLCMIFDMSIEDIEGDLTIEIKSMNLVRLFQRTGRMPELMSALRNARKDMSWE